MALHGGVDDEPKDPFGHIGIETPSLGLGAVTLRHRGLSVGITRRQAVGRLVPADLVTHRETLRENFDELGIEGVDTGT